MPHVDRRAAVSRPALLRPNQAAQFLGISPSHMRAMIRRGDFRGVREGKMVMVPRHEVEAWLAARGVPGVHLEVHYEGDIEGGAETLLAVLDGRAVTTGSPLGEGPPGDDGQGVPPAAKPGAPPTTMRRERELAAEAPPERTTGTVSSGGAS